MTCSSWVPTSPALNNVCKIKMVASGRRSLWIPDTQKQPCQRVEMVRGCGSGAMCPTSAPASWGWWCWGCPLPPARPLPRVGESETATHRARVLRETPVGPAVPCLFLLFLLLLESEVFGSQVGHLKHCTSFGKSKCVFKGKRLSSGVIVYFVVGNDQ